MAGLYAAVAAAWIPISDASLLDPGMPVSDLHRWSVLKGLGFVVVTAALLYALLVWDRRVLERQRAARHDAEERLAGILEGLPHGVAECDGEGRITWSNAPLRRLAGAGQNSLEGRPLESLVEGEKARVRVREALAALRRTAGTTQSLRAPVQDGEGHPRLVQVDLLVLRPEGAGPPGFLATVTDVTAEERAARALRVRSAASRALVRATEGEALLREICTLAVEEGGYEAAWVGLEEEPEGAGLRPVATAGRATSLVQVLDLLGQGQATCPARQAARARRTHVEPDVATMATRPAWLDRALREGLHAVCAVPIALEDETWGALTILAATAHAFDEGEVALLEQLGADLAFGLRSVAEHQTLLSSRANLARRVDRSVHALAASENRYRILAETAPQIVWSADREGNITYVNQALTRLTGVAVEAALGDGWMEALPEEDREGAVARWRESVRTGGRYEGQMRMRDASGHYRTYQYQADPYRDEAGAIVGWVGMHADVTEMVEAGRQQERLARSLEAANARLHELDRMRSLFVAGVSHELRSPLNAIVGFSALLLQGTSGELAARQRDRVERIHRAARHLLSLITDLLEASRVEQGEAEVEVAPFSLGPLLEEARDTVIEQATAKGLGVTIAAPETIRLHTDRRRLFQCVLNLADNAVKFTEQGSVHLEAATTGAEVEIAVRDTGRGIPAKDRERLFEPFARAVRPEGTGVPGSGLGLFLTRRLAEAALGGRVGVEDAPGGGSRFWIRVPLRHPSLDAPTARGDRPSAPGR